MPEESLFEMKDRDGRLYLTRKTFSISKASLAGVLHDIGKLFQRADDQRRHARHAEYSHLYVKEKGLPDDVREAVRCHHASGGAKTPGIRDAKEPLSWLIYEADNIASSTRVSRESGDYSFEEKTALSSIFNFTRLSDDPDLASPERWLRLNGVALSDLSKNLNQFFPQNDARNHRSNYDDLRKKWVEKTDRSDFSHTADNYLNLLELVGSFIPSETSVDSTNDISLFDHSKSTAAIAACMAAYFNEKGGPSTLQEVGNRDDKRFILLVGDLSGIQKFVFRTATKGALRMLRARSFYLELLTEVVALNITRALELARANIIFTGGGGFQLLLPNTEEARKVLEDQKRSVNDFLAEGFNRELYLAIGYSELSANDLRARGTESKQMPETGSEQQEASIFAERLGEALREVRKDKRRKYLESLGALFNPQPVAGHDVCPYCARYDATVKSSDYLGEEIVICDHCQSYLKAAGKLTRAGLVLVNSDLDSDFELPGARVALIIGKETDREAIQAQPDFVFAINDFEHNMLFSTPSAPLMLGSIAARVDQRLKSFEEFAYDSFGADRIGALRLDVDNLGLLFSRGLSHRVQSSEESSHGEEQTFLGTFDRYAALSRNLNFFFKFLLNEILHQPVDGETAILPAPDMKDNLNVVYSGGDDLFLVGGWSEVFWAAVKIRRAFRRFTANNPDLTLSGGFIVQESHYPLYRLAEEAGDAEERAKSTLEECRKEECSATWSSCVLRLSNDDRVLCGRKDAVTLFELPAGENGQRNIFHWGELDGELRELPTRGKDFILSDAISLFTSDRFVKEKNDHLELVFPGGFLYRLRQIENDYLRRKQLALPPLVYLLARMGETRISDNGGKVALSKIEEWRKLCMSLKEPRFIEQVLSASIDYLSLARKSHSEDEE